MEKDVEKDVEEDDNAEGKNEKKCKKKAHEDVKEEKKDEDQSVKFKDLIEGVKKALGDSVSDVRVSNKLVDSACCLVASDSGMDVQMERIMKMQNQDFKGMPRILEINPNHSLINYMDKILKTNQKEFDDLSKIVLDQARLLEGHLPSDVSFYCKKINELITNNV